MLDVSTYTEHPCFLNKAIEKFKTQPRFIGHEEDFYISKYIINHEEWKDGYFCSDDLKGDM